MLKSIQKWLHSNFLEMYGFSWLYWDFFYMLQYFWQHTVDIQIWTHERCLLNHVPQTKAKRKKKCQRWIRACGRELFTVEKVTRWTYICSKNLVGGHGPTDQHPGPIPATYTPFQVWENIVVIRLHEKVPISISRKYIVFLLTK